MQHIDDGSATELIQGALEIFIESYRRTGIRVPDKGAFERWIVYVAMCHYFKPFNRESTDQLRVQLVDGGLPDDYISELLYNYDDSLELLETYSRMMGLKKSP